MIDSYHTSLWELWFRRLQESRICKRVLVSLQVKPLVLNQCNDTPVMDIQLGGDVTQKRYAEQLYQLITPAYSQQRQIWLNIVVLQCCGGIIEWDKSFLRSHWTLVKSSFSSCLLSSLSLPLKLPLKMELSESSVSNTISCISCES